MRVSPGVQCLIIALLLSGCAWHRKPTSYNRIILEGDPNPTIVDAPTRAGDTVRISNRPRQQPQPLPTLEYPQGTSVDQSAPSSPQQ